VLAHRKRQDQEREHAGTEWREGGWMFFQPNGKPLDPRRDQYQWKALLKEAGSARHGCMTRGTQPQPLCCCSASPSGP
jgi:hypothetical protein